MEIERLEIEAKRDATVIPILLKEYDRRNEYEKAIDFCLWRDKQYILDFTYTLVLRNKPCIFDYGGGVVVSLDPSHTTEHLRLLERITQRNGSIYFGRSPITMEIFGRKLILTVSGTVKNLAYLYFTEFLIKSYENSSNVLNYLDFNKHKKEGNFFFTNLKNELFKHKEEQDIFQAYEKILITPEEFTKLSTNSRSTHYQQDFSAYIRESTFEFIKVLLNICNKSKQERYLKIDPFKVLLTFFLKNWTNGDYIHG